MITATEIYCLNELGRRSNNEDSISPAKGTATAKDTLFIVCDGVGGENKGEVASELVCQSIREYIDGHQPQPGQGREVIEAALDYTQEKLKDYVSGCAEAKRMSTTMALVLLDGPSVLAAWCGDTRIHHIRDGKVVWKSRDHSLVSELVSQGELTEAEARIHPKRNVITRSLNAQNYNSIVDFHEIRNFETGDYLLLCTDGFLEQVDDRILHHVLMNGEEQDKAAHFLAHCEGATRDNFSMYLIRGKVMAPKKKSLPVWAFILAISMLLLLCTLALLG